MSDPSGPYHHPGCGIRRKSVRPRPAPVKELSAGSLDVRRLCQEHRAREIRIGVARSTPPSHPTRRRSAPSVRPRPPAWTPPQPPAFSALRQLLRGR
jgi:hypothetical protein